MNKQKLSILIILISIIGFLNPLFVMAEIDSNVGYDIQAILPENQRNQDMTYFDLTMKPGQKQTIEVLINNTSDKKATYTVLINQAYTNKQGFIDYAESDVEMDKSLKFPVKDIFNYEKEVTVNAKESVYYPININMPKESFDGQIMAGIQIMRKEDTKTNSSITNKVGYILGINLTETGKEIKRKLELTNVKPEVSFGKTSIVATLVNPTMEAYGHLKYVVNIENSAGDNVRSVTYDTGMQLAPNSIYNLAIDWEGKALSPGAYNINLVVTDAKKNKWTFDENFEITSKEANDINKITVDAGESPTISLWILILIVVIAVIILILIILLVKKKVGNKKKEL